MTGVAFGGATSPSGAARSLDAAGIHVWTARLDLPDEIVGRFGRLLSGDERERADCMRLPPQRRRWVASRALVRHILGEYVGVPSRSLRFAYGAGGKPELAGIGEGEPISFNLSHSGDILLVAVGTAPALGVDVERVRPIPRANSLLRRAFGEAERERILSLSGGERTEALIRGWTRKEACVKAAGERMWSARDRFEVTVLPGEPPAVVDRRPEAEGTEPWSLYHLEPAPGYVGALAARGSGWRLRTFALEPEPAG